MTVLRFPADQRNAHWYQTSPVTVRWDATLDQDVPVVEAVGTIMVRRDDLSEDGTEDEDAGYVEAGKIHIAKPFLCGEDVNLAMDALTSDHEYLASELFDGADYHEAFAQWFEAEFGLILSGDPIFVLDLEIAPGYRDPDAMVASHAALAALATFGSSDSPLVTFYLDGVHPDLRDGLREAGLWLWVHALRAKRWKNVYVAARPWSASAGPGSD